MVIVYTTGVFDLLHPGHINILRRARGLGDRLVVGCQDDSSVEKQKGKKPILSCDDRISMLESLPFVDVVIPYHDLDQRPMLDMIKPDIVVQGGDWHLSADRSEIIQYLEEKKIKLIQFPYTKGISSTDIKERVYFDLKTVKRDKSLDFDFYKKLMFVPIDALLIYEDYDLKRVEKLVESISATQTFFNPITVGEIGPGKGYLVIDGANRLEALKRIGAQFAFVQVVDYLVGNEVELKNNEHYLSCSLQDFQSILSQNGISLIPKDNFEKIVEKKTNNFLATVTISESEYILGSLDSDDLSKKTEILNKFVSAYKGKLTICRKSEVSNISGNYSIVIKFHKFTPDNIVEIAYRKLHLESGITWHIIDNSVIHFKIPIQILLQGFHCESQARDRMKEIIDQKLQSGAVRRYVSHTFVCDEWEF